MTDTIEKLMKVATNLVSRIEAMEKKEFPQIGGRYFYLINGNIGSCVFKGDERDENRRATGNFFKTEQEAQQELDCQLVEHELRCCEGRIITDCYSWGIFTNRLNSLDVASNVSLFNIKYNVAKHAKAAIEKIGKDRILAAAEWKAERPVY